MTYVFITLLVLTITSCQSGSLPHEEADPYQEQADSEFTNKKVMLIILDSMMRSSLDKSLMSWPLWLLLERIKNQKQVEWWI